MQLESNIPSHRAFPFLGDTLEDFHIELPLIVDNRYAGAVNIVYSGTLPVAREPQEHCEDYETTWHYFHNFLRRPGVLVDDGIAYYAISSSNSNSLQKSSAIQKISLTLLSVIMICILQLNTSNSLNISDITKRIGNFSRLPIQLF